MLCSRLTLNRRTFLVVILWVGTGFSQISPLSPSEDALAAGVQALKAGDMEAAQEFLHQALERGVKRAIVFHNRVSLRKNVATMRKLLQGSGNHCFWIQTTVRADCFSAPVFYHLGKRMTRCMNSSERSDQCQTNPQHIYS